MNIRDFFRQILREDDRFADIDLRDGSAFMSLVVDPLSVLLRPLDEDLAAVVQSQTLANYAEMSDIEMDGYAENFLVSRIVGNRATTTVRLYFPQPTPVSIAAGHSFLTAGGLVFEATAPYTLTEAAMAERQQDAQGLYITDDIPVQAAAAGAEYLVDVGEITEMSPPAPGLSRVENPTRATGGSDRESNEALYNRLQHVISTRQVLNKAGTEFRLREQFPSLEEILLIGFGDEEMGRDRIFLSKEANLSSPIASFEGKVRRQGTGAAYQLLSAQKKPGLPPAVQWQEISQEGYVGLARRNDAQIHRIDSGMIFADDFDRYEVDFSPAETTLSANATNTPTVQVEDASRFAANDRIHIGYFEQALTEDTDGTAKISVGFVDGLAVGDEVIIHDNAGIRRNIEDISGKILTLTSGQSTDGFESGDVVLVEDNIRYERHIIDTISQPNNTITLAKTPGAFANNAHIALLNSQTKAIAGRPNNNDTINLTETVAGIEIGSALTLVDAEGETRSISPTVAGSTTITSSESVVGFEPDDVIIVRDDGSYHQQDIADSDGTPTVALTATGSVADIRQGHAATLVDDDFSSDNRIAISIRNTDGTAVVHTAAGESTASIRKVTGVKVRLASASGITWTIADTAAGHTVTVDTGQDPITGIGTGDEITIVDDDDETGITRTVASVAGQVITFSGGGLTNNQFDNNPRIQVNNLVRKIASVRPSQITLAAAETGREATVPTGFLRTDDAHIDIHALPFVVDAVDATANPDTITFTEAVPTGFLRANHAKIFHQITHRGKIASVNTTTRVITLNAPVPTIFNLQPEIYIDTIRRTVKNITTGAPNQIQLDKALPNGFAASDGTCYVPKAIVREVQATDAEENTITLTEPVPIGFVTTAGAKVHSILPPLVRTVVQAIGTRLICSENIASGYQAGHRVLKVFRPQVLGNEWIESTKGNRLGIEADSHAIVLENGAAVLGKPPIASGAPDQAEIKDHIKESLHDAGYRQRGAQTIDSLIAGLDLSDLTSAVTTGRTAEGDSPVMQHELSQHNGIRITGTFRTNDDNTTKRFSYIHVLRGNSGAANVTDGFGFAWRVGSTNNLAIVDNSQAEVNRAGRLAQASHAIKADTTYRFEMLLNAPNAGSPQASAIEVRIWPDDGAILRPTDPAIQYGAYEPINARSAAGHTHFGISVDNCMGAQWHYDDLRIDSIATQYAHMLFELPITGDTGFNFQCRCAGRRGDDYGAKVYAWNFTARKWDEEGSNTTASLQDIAAPAALPRATYVENNKAYLLASSQHANSTTESAILDVDYVAAFEDLSGGTHVGGKVDIYAKTAESPIVVEKVFTSWNHGRMLRLTTENGFQLPIQSVDAVLQGSGAIATDYTHFVGDEDANISMRENNALLFASAPTASAGNPITIRYTHVPILSDMQRFIDDENERIPNSDVLIRGFHPVYVDMTVFIDGNPITFLAMSQRLQKQIYTLDTTLDISRDIIQFLETQGVRDVRTPIVVTTQEQAANGSLKAEQTTSDARTISRTARFVPRNVFVAQYVAE